MYIENFSMKVYSSKFNHKDVSGFVELMIIEKKILVPPKQ